MLFEAFLIKEIPNLFLIGTEEYDKCSIQPFKVLLATLQFTCRSEEKDDRAEVAALWACGSSGFTQTCN